MKRDLLTPEFSIKLCSMADNLFTRSFTIQRVIGQGASSVVYEAYHDGSRLGVLHEYYPTTLLGLSRDENGQLICADDDKEEFNVTKRQYLAPYKKVFELKHIKSLSTFIPPCEIYTGYLESNYSCNEKNTTVYVWSPLSEAISFETICDSIRRQPILGASSNFLLVIRAMRTLGACVAELHKAGIICRDIKPNNFGFKKLNADVLPETIQLFDIDSFCSVFDKEISNIVGTEGYTEPEVKYNFPSNLTDIYSLGATLLNAIATEEYTLAEYPNIEKLVKTSTFVAAAGVNDKGITKLIHSIKSALAERKLRCQSCEEFVNNMDELIENFTYNLDWGKEHEKLSETCKVVESIPIKLHLFEHPLYNYSSNNEFNVLVVGFKKHSINFFNTCLELGQNGERLNVTVFTDNSADKDEYLKTAKALGDFFTIDGALAKSSSPYASYGNVNFVISSSYNDLKIKSVLKERKIRYAFVDIGNDMENFKLASKIKADLDELSENEGDNFVSFVVTADDFYVEFDSLCPICIGNDYSKNEIFPTLNKMVLNFHILENQRFNFDCNYSAVLHELSDPYYYLSCLSSVLSIKYKIHNLGIELDPDFLLEAANDFSLLMKEKPNLRQELIFNEHKRFVTNMITQGWTRLEEADLKNIKSKRDLQNRTKKKHACILKSLPNENLFKSFGDDVDKWNHESLKNCNFDALDTMSITLHRAFYEKAEQSLKHSHRAYHALEEEIREFLSNFPSLKAIFEELASYIEEISSIEGSSVNLLRGKAALIDSVQNRFLEVLRSNNVYSKFKPHISFFNEYVTPLIERARFKNYKEDYWILIEGIPFILSYSTKNCLVIPLNDSANTITDKFNNICASLIVRPSEVIFIYRDDGLNDFDDASIIQMLDFLLNRKQSRAFITFVIIYPSLERLKMWHALEQKMSLLYLQGVNFVFFHKSEATTRLRKYLLNLKKKNKFGVFAIEQNNSRTCAFIEGCALLNGEFAYYTFNSKNMQFLSPNKECRNFNYIKKNAFITVHDVFAFSRGQIIQMTNPPEFKYIYQKLFDKCMEDSTLYKKFCDKLQKHIGFLKFASLEKYKDKHSNNVDLTYSFGPGFRDNIDRVMRQLQSLYVIKNFSIHFGSICQVNFQTLEGRNHIAFEKIFKEHYDKLGEIHIDEHDAYVNVVWDNLRTRNFLKNLSETEKKVLSLEDAFRFSQSLEALSLITNLKKNENGLSFYFTSPAVKDLLIKSGSVLELFTYHELRKSGFFMDIVRSLVIHWDNKYLADEGVTMNETMNELDLILTKGFQTLFVECKLVSKLSPLTQDYYHKLRVLAQRFGVNCQPVLIAAVDDEAREQNNLLAQRGKKLGIITIYKESDIKNIGITLQKIFEGNFEKPSS